LNLIDEEARAVRARNLGQLNGLAMVLVSLQPAVSPAEAVLELHFINTNQVAAILAGITATPSNITQVFPIFGGFRVRAGNGEGQVQVTNVAAGPAANVLLLTVAPVGDYSTYTLGVRFPNIDPFFDEIEFKFRPGCFTNDCAPEWCPGDPALPEPAIDYLAKDFDSFKHTMLVALQERVPGWRPTSEADLDQVLLELFSAAADELSDFQDRVMNEAYLATARKRVSLMRHSRLMDYYVHQGNQASTWLALEIAALPGTLPAGVLTGTHGGPSEAQSQVFVTREAASLHPLLNRIRLYSWSGAVTGLAGGATSADLLLDSPSQANAQAVLDLIAAGDVRHLLIQEHLNPATGLPGGRDPGKRQILTLIPDRAELVHDPDPSNPADPALGAWLVSVHWREKLRHAYCFLVTSPATDEVSLFHGNLVIADHGRPRELTFLPPDEAPAHDRERNYELPSADECRLDECSDAQERLRGVTCRLPLDVPQDLPLLYRNTTPGGEVPSLSTLQVTVLPAGALVGDRWDEVPDLVHSDDGSESGDHFVVETDEELRSIIRFGNGINGRELPAGARVECWWQAGDPLEGNVGAGTVNSVEITPATAALLTGALVWNPFDVIDGRAPEPVAEVIRRVPEAYRARQLRAVTTQDYVRRAEEVPGVARAAARYAWTGSWRTVQIAIDPEGTTELSPHLRALASRHLEVVRLIGEDLEIREPIYVPLQIDVLLCIHPGYWPEDVRFFIEQELSDAYTADGRLGFFHPDRWTFGQPLHVSEISGRIQLVQGVDHVVSVAMRRWDAATSGTADTITVRANEIIRVQNDPDHMEEGSITLDIQGGRQ
jgi:hypothetical protein